MRPPYTSMKNPKARLRAPWRSVVAAYSKGVLRDGCVIKGADLHRLHGAKGENDIEMIQMDLVINKAPLRLRRLNSGYLVRPVTPPTPNIIFTPANQPLRFKSSQS